MYNLISIIIPVFNEEKNLHKLIHYLRDVSSEPDMLEIIIVEATSENDNQKTIAEENIIYVKSKIHQRGIQMNLGVKSSKGEILYFLHADSFPPLKFDEAIRKAMHNNQLNFGCFRLKFNLNNYVLSFYSYFTRFHHDIFHGGDASLFVSRTLFNSVKGYDETMKLMEDYDIIRRLKKVGKFIVLPEKITTSARKYKAYGMIRLQWIYSVIQMMFRINMSQESMLKYYRRKVK